METILFYNEFLFESAADPPGSLGQYILIHAPVYLYLFQQINR